MEYNISTSSEQASSLKIYAELIGNYKNLKIKSSRDNIIEDIQKLKQASLLIVITLLKAL